MVCRNLRFILDCYTYEGAAQVARDENGRPFIIVRESVLSNPYN